MSKVHIAYGVDAAKVQKTSFENDTVTAVTHGHGEQETGLAAADEQPKVTVEIDVELLKLPMRLTLKLQLLKKSIVPLKKIGMVV